MDEKTKAGRECVFRTTAAAATLGLGRRCQSGEGPSASWREGRDSPFASSFSGLAPSWVLCGCYVLGSWDPPCRIDIVLPSRRLAWEAEEKWPG